MKLGRIMGRNRCLSVSLILFWAGGIGEEGKTGSSATLRRCERLVCTDAVEDVEWCCGGRDKGRGRLQRRFEVS